MAGFVQIIEYKSSRIEEIRALIEDLRKSGAGTALGGTLTADRDRPGYHFSIVEFASAESAMENSQLPEVSELARKMAELCDGPAKFYNLDVVESWDG